MTKNIIRHAISLPSDLEISAVSIFVVKQPFVMLCSLVKKGLIKLEDAAM